MCFDKRDSVIANLCQERDQLRNLVQKQFEAYQQTVEMVLELDSVIAERDALLEDNKRLNEAYEAMSRDLEKMAKKLFLLARENADDYS